MAEAMSIYPEDTIGSAMDPALAVFDESVTIGDITDTLRELVKREFITYAFIVNGLGVLRGVVAMRDLLFNDATTPVADVMIKSPFFLKAEEKVLDAMKSMLSKHFPVYPVCDSAGHLKGEVRGAKLFELQAFELSAQAGSMVGVEKEERPSTPWKQSFKYRHPWLQLNLLTAFAAGAVVSMFQGTIDRLVILASFLPVLAGQSGNTGCQALAVTLRGLTIGDLANRSVRQQCIKEVSLGILNGFFVGLIAAGAMYALALNQGSEHPATLALIVLGAMVISCAISGLSGTVIPLALKKFGADPATASSIFLTTATDICSMGLLLGLASVFL